jgi:hypothetical protein
MNRTFQQSYHVVGTLGADWNIRFYLPFDAQLIHVSAVGSNAYAAGLNIGSSSDTDAYLTKSDIGVSNTPVEFDRDDFVGDQYPHIADGTIIVLQLDYNYAGGGSANASADVTVVLTFTEG